MENENLSREQEQQEQTATNVNFRILLSTAVLILPLFLLVGRLYQLQITQGKELRNLTENQYMRLVVTPSVRGQIYSADGEILAGNRTHYDLTMHPSLMRNPRGILITSDNMLKTVTDIEENIMFRKSNLKDINSLRSHMSRDMSQPIVIFSDLTEEEMARCEEMMPMPKGIAVTPRIERDYPLPGVATHILGMTNWRQITLPQKAYSIKEIHGVDGLEAKYDKELSGSTGFKTIIKDPSGFIRDEMPGATAKINGFNLKLTIDSKAQAAAENALDGLRGALVAINPNNGAVIAMASSPTYSLAEMSGAYYAALLEDTENKPLYNRATMGRYMPGSIVKPLIALAALENDVIDKDSTYECTGYYAIGGAKIHCAKRYGGHGELDVSHAIAVSCNPFFINVGIMSKLRILEQAYTSAGFGKSLDFDLHNAAGTIPSQQTAKRLWNRNWLMIDSAYASLGQGAVEITPLQGARYAAALANNGTLWKPYLLSQILEQDGHVVKETKPEKQGQLPYSAENMQLIHDAMVMAVNENGASATAMKKACVPLAAKTGTAEVGSKQNRHKNTWIICYGPVDSPEFAVACVIENGGSGGTTTAPVVVDFINNWLSDRTAE